MGIWTRFVAAGAAVFALAAGATPMCEADYEALFAVRGPVISPPLTGPRPATTSHRTLAEDMRARIHPFFESGTEGYFTGARGTPIHYRFWSVPNAKGTIVLSHGFRESMNVYRELIFNLAENGYNVYILDHRSHGSSGGRPEDPRMVHVERFDDYVRDLRSFVTRIVLPNGHDRFHLVGHSMGGAIAARYTERHPAEVERLALITPMMGVRLPPPLNAYAAQSIAWTLSLLGFGRAYTFGTNPDRLETYYRPDSDERDRITSRMRWELNQEGPRQAGPSFGWLLTALSGARVARESGPCIRRPTLLVEVGREEIVDNAAMERFCRSVPDCRHILFPEADHSPHLADDPVRDRLLRDLFAFLRSE